jgi:hypothetical protein
MRAVGFLAIVNCLDSSWCSRELVMAVPVGLKGKIIIIPPWLTNFGLPYVTIHRMPHTGGSFVPADLNQRTRILVKVGSATVDLDKSFWWWIAGAAATA